MNEIYLEVKEFGGRILVSNLGKVYSMKGNRILPQHLTGKYYKQGRGYPSVYIREAKGARKVHRMVAEAFLEDWDKALQVDHIDGDTLNNSLSNLRMATDMQNKMGYKTPKGVSGYRGVSWHKTKKCWEAEMSHNGVRYWLGRHKTPESGALAWNGKAIELGFFKEALNCV
jgi:hypothetical protein